MKCIPPASGTADKTANGYHGGSHHTSQLGIVARGERGHPYRKWTGMEWVGC
jgi:hypothetical protein